MSRCRAQLGIEARCRPDCRCIDMNGIVFRRRLQLKSLYIIVYTSIIKILTSLRRVWVGSSAFQNNGVLLPCFLNFSRIRHNVGVLLMLFGHVYDMNLLLFNLLLCTDWYTLVVVQFLDITWYIVLNGSTVSLRSQFMVNPYNLINTCVIQSTKLHLKAWHSKRTLL